MLVAGGLEKIAAISGLLRAGLVAGLITDGDTALALAAGTGSADPAVRPAVFAHHRRGLETTEP